VTGKAHESPKGLRVAGVKTELDGHYHIDHDPVATERSAECPHCGHGLMWHPPMRRDVLTDEPSLDSEMCANTDPTGCAGNCSVCDLIEGIMEFGSAISRSGTRFAATTAAINSVSRTSLFGARTVKRQKFLGSLQRHMRDFSKPLVWIPFATMILVLATWGGGLRSGGAVLFSYALVFVWEELKWKFGEKDVEQSIEMPGWKGTLMGWVALLAAIALAVFGK